MDAERRSYKSRFKTREDLVYAHTAPTLIQVHILSRTRSHNHQKIIIRFPFSYRHGNHILECAVSVILAVIAVVCRKKLCEDEAAMATFN